MARTLVGSAAADALARARQRAAGNKRFVADNTPQTGGDLTVGSGAPQTGGPLVAGNVPNLYANINPQDMLSSGFNYQNGPEGDMFNNVFTGATQGSTQSFNNAANRLRERIDASTAGAVNDVTNRNLSRGFGNSGINDAGIYQAQAAGQDAYAQGLAGLESDFEKNRLAGLGIAGDVASNQARNTQTKNQFDLSNRNTMDQLLMQLLGNREDNTARSNLQMSDQKFQGKENALNRADALKPFEYNKMASERDYQRMLDEEKRKKAAMRLPRLTSTINQGASLFGRAGRG